MWRLRVGYRRRSRVRRTVDDSAHPSESFVPVLLSLADQITSAGTVLDVFERLRLEQ